MPLPPEKQSAKFSQKQKKHNKIKMRQLTDHKLNGLNDALEINVLDEPGQGNANHKYEIAFRKFSDELNSEIGGLTQINFQNGPIKEFGVNGISNEALLAIVIDRLRGFQSGDYACPDNENALASAQNTLYWLQKRTKDRLNRGVEGTNIK